MATGLATGEGATDVSNWAMKLSVLQDSGDVTDANAFKIDSAPNEGGGSAVSFSQYHTIPNTYTKVAHKNTSTDMAASTGGVKLTTTYAAYISKTQPADTYSGQVIYTLVHPANHMAPVACTPSGTTISTIVCMQDISATNKDTILASMTEGIQYTLRDKRDGKAYKVAKLADGEVWMTQNLDLDLDESTTYTNLDTDLGWNTSTNSYDVASWSPIRSTYGTSPNHIHAWCQGGVWSYEYGYCDINNSPESYDPGDIYWNGATTQNWSDIDAYYYSCDFSTPTPSCNESLNPLSTYTTVSGTPTPQYHLGNYYNWAAAIATNDASVYGSSNLESHQSICPAGWTLPYTNINSQTGQYSGDFANLWTEYGWTYYNKNFSNGISTIWSNPIYSAPSGRYFGTLVDVGGSTGFWSPIAIDNDNVRGAGYGVGGLADPADGARRHYGYLVRCILR